MTSIAAAPSLAFTALPGSHSPFDRLCKHLVVPLDIQSKWLRDAYATLGHLHTCTCTGHGIWSATRSVRLWGRNGCPSTCARCTSTYSRCSAQSDQPAIHVQVPCTIWLLGHVNQSLSFVTELPTDMARLNGVVRASAGWSASPLSHKRPLHRHSLGFMRKTCPVPPPE